MRIREEFEAIKKSTGRSPVNIEQFAENRNELIKIKFKFKESFGYSPGFIEAMYIIENGLSKPEKCRHPECNNFAKFRNKTQQYAYCCKTCSDTDPIRNKDIQSKRIPKINYGDVHRKVVSTKNKIGDDGLNVHQRAAQKTLETRNVNYSNWYDKTLIAIRNKSSETKTLASEKRSTTIYEKYGVTHFGGGYSKLKRLIIDGKEFLYQGYEDVALYELINDRKISVNDIDACVRFGKHSFKYEFGQYFPDLFIISTNTYIEVKSLYWENKDKYKDLKRNAVLIAGFNYERIVYDDKQYVERARMYFKNQNCYIKA
jgi:hypothetical protein